MMVMEKKWMQEFDDINYLIKDGRLTEPSDGKRYEWRKLIEEVERIGRPLTEQEMEQYRIR